MLALSIQDHIQTSLVPPFMDHSQPTSLPAHISPLPAPCSLLARGSCDEQAVIHGNRSPASCHDSMGNTSINSDHTSTPSSRKLRASQRQSTSLLHEGSRGARARWEETARRLQAILQPAAPARVGISLPSSSSKERSPWPGRALEAGRTLEAEESVKPGGSSTWKFLPWRPRAVPEGMLGMAEPAPMEDENAAADKSDEVFHLVSELLTHLPCPLLLVVDDAHVIDSLSWTLLLRLCGTMPRGCLLLCTCEEAASAEVTKSRPPQE